MAEILGPGSLGCAVVGGLRSMKGRELFAILGRAPLSYRVQRQKGSHRTLVADGRPRLLFAFHDSDEVPVGLVRKVLMKDVGLSEEEMLELL